MIDCNLPANPQHLSQAVLYLKTYLRDAKQVENKTPLAFLYELHAKSGLERKALRFTYSRLNSLLRTLEVTECAQCNTVKLCEAM